MLGKVLVVLPLAVAACVVTPAGLQAQESTVPHIDANQATVIAKQVFRNEVVPKQPSAARLDHLLDDEGPTTLARSCRDVQRQIEARLGSGVGAATLHGSIAALDRKGTCWVVSWDGRRGPGLGAAIDAASGAALFLWEMPEG
jgi:hypothetical protein